MNPPPAYTIGVAMGVSPEGIVVDRLVAGGAAETAGLQEGDKLLSANGVAFGQDPMQVLRKSLTAGTPIKLTIDRDGKQLEITVTPKRRDE